MLVYNHSLNTLETGILYAEVTQQKGNWLFHRDPIMHLVYPAKSCITIVLDFSWDVGNAQEKLETIVL